MLDEFASDVDKGALHISSRLTGKGRASYGQLLREAIADKDEVWLADALRSTGYMYTTEVKRNPGKPPTVVRIPITASMDLAEEEFARFHARGVCRRAIEDGISNVVVYRANPGEDRRPESQAVIGSEISAETLLADLRAHQGIESALRLPTPSTSILSVRLP